MTFEASTGRLCCCVTSRLNAICPVCEHGGVTESERQTNTGLGGYGGRRLAELLGPLNVWSFALQRMSGRDEAAAAQSLEQVGYRAIWVPESLGSKEAMAPLALLLQATNNAVIAPGIANIHARDPMAMASGAKTLGEQFPGRLVLGIGVSHAPSVESRGSQSGPPLEVITHYLDALDDAVYAEPLARPRQCPSF